MEHKRIVSLIAIGIIAVFVFSTCVKDEVDFNKISSNITWNPKLGLPVAYAELSLKDLIESQDTVTRFVEDSTHFLSIVYSKRIFSSRADEVMKVPNQNYHEVLLESDFALPPIPLVDTIKLFRDRNYTLNFDYGEVIDTVNIKSGIMGFTIKSTYKHTGYMQIVVPQLVKNKKPFTLSVLIDKADGTFSSTQNIDLTGYQLKPTHLTGSDNIISYSFKAYLKNSGQGISVGDNITVDITLNNVSFKSIFGYLGQRELLNFQSAFELALFQNSSKFNLDFFDPKLKLYFNNSYGLPARVELYNVHAVSKTNQNLAITFAPGVNPFNIPYPLAVGLFKKDSVTFSYSNTNLRDLFSIGPADFYYGVKATSNPAGKTLNYVTDSSKIDIDMNLEIPLNFRSGLFEFMDTVDLDLSDFIGDTVNLKSVLLHTVFENGMPFDLSLQVYLANQNFVPIDSLFTSLQQPIISSGILDVNGKVIKSTKKPTDAPITGARIPPLDKVRKAIIKAGIVTTNGGKDYVKFYSTYKLGVNFGVQTQVEVNKKL